MLAEQHILERLALHASAEKRIYYGVTWDDYLNLLNDLNEAAHVRVTFDRGVLEVMSPKSEHEELTRLVDLVVANIAFENNQNVKNCGSMTMHTVAVERGGEPDSSYYVGSEPQVRGVKNIDLSVHPPPDIVLKIGISSPSLDKFGLYAAVGVPEVWRYDGAQVRFYVLTGDSYTQIADSRTFPQLSASTLQRLLQLGREQGSSAMLHRVRDQFTPDRN